jgi:hypothetical protein
MSQKIERRIRAGAIALLVSAAAGQPARAMDATCKPVLDAMAKRIATPSHVYATEAGARGGKPEIKESIYAGGAIYIQHKGKWVRSPISIQEMRKQEVENVRDAKAMTCRYLRDETVNGEAAAVYHSQAETAGAKSDATLWVSKRTGLPLRSENNIDTGDGDKMHMAIRYDYTDVRPPAGVK